VAVPDGMAVPVGDGRLLGLNGMVIDWVIGMVIDMVMAGEVMAAVIVPEMVAVPEAGADIEGVIDSDLVVDGV